MKNKLVVIPSSKFIEFELRQEFGHIPPVLLPYSDHNVIYELQRIYENIATDILVGCHQGKELFDQYLAQSSLPVTSVDVGKTFDVGHTVYKLLSFHSSSLEDTELYINFGDTVVSPSIITETENVPDFLLTSTVNDSWKWTLAAENQGMLSFSDKVDSDDPIEKQAVIGVVRINNPELFYDILGEKVVESLDLGGESLYSALTQYSKMNKVNLVPISNRHWVDVGHLDRLDDSRKNLRARDFNSITIDTRRGMLTKKSKHHDKLAKEIQWYLELPKQLHFCIPRIFDYSLREDQVSVSMEYYGYPALADIFVHGNLKIDKWKSILVDLKWILDTFTEFTCERSAKQLNQLRHEMYVGKTIERISHYRFPDELSQIASGCTVNGQKAMPLSEIMDALDKVYEWCFPKDLEQLSIMHGDFCLSNILYDSRSNVLRLIDPRGSFGETFIYGDPLYDLAKLSHSIRGNYDFIVREQFYYERQSDRITFRPFVTDSNHNLIAIFNDIFIGNDSDKRNKIDFIESMLFISMIPLHDDSEFKQLGMLLTGMSKFTALFERYRSSVLTQLNA